MNSLVDDIRSKLSEKGLKITPQRMGVLQAVYTLNNHPTADHIIAHIHKSHPNIATGTVYKVLETLVDNQLIRKVKTEGDAMRYDGIMEPHHHLYCTSSDFISDYVDQDLDKLLMEHFKSKNIPGFKIEEIVLHIRGTFDKY